MPKTNKNYRNTDEFISSLTIEELRFIVKRFWNWATEDDCPRSLNSDFPCTWSEDDDFDADNLCECPYGQCGCWVERYLWAFRKEGEEGKC